MIIVLLELLVFCDVYSLRVFDWGLDGSCELCLNEPFIVLSDINVTGVYKSVELRGRKTGLLLRVSEVQIFHMCLLTLSCCYHLGCQ